MKQPLRFGVNYVPSKHWWYSWLEWDEDSIAHDLEAIAALGFDHIRIHCLWSYFQPDLSCVSERALKHLTKLFAIADSVNLDVHITVLNGWLSGFVFNPPWQQGKNMFTDESVIAAEKSLFQALADTVGTHPRFLGFDLGNELGVLQQRSEKVSGHEADLWQRDMFAHCEKVAPGKFHVNGVDHVHWLSDVGFSRSGLATSGAATTLHAWAPFTGFLDRYGPVGQGTLHLAEFMVELAKAYHSDSTRPVWLQEVGVSSTLTPLGQIPTFAEATLNNVMTCESLWGVTWWCSHDINPSFSGFAPFEYDLGVLTQDNRVKPLGQQLAQLIQKCKTQPPIPIQRNQALVLPDTLIAQGKSALWSFVDAYMQFTNDGVRPAIVLGSKSRAPAHLKERGIKTLLYPKSIQSEKEVETLAYSQH